MVSPPDQQHFGACFCSSSLPCFFTVVGDIFCHFPRDCGFFFQYILRMKYLLIVNHICYLQQRFWLIYFGCYLTLFFCLKVIYFYPYIQMCLFSIIIFFRKTHRTVLYFWVEPVDFISIFYVFVRLSGIYYMLRKYFLF